MRVKKMNTKRRYCLCVFKENNIDAAYEIGGKVGHDNNIQSIAPPLRDE